VRSFSPLRWLGLPGTRLGSLTRGRDICRSRFCTYCIIYTLRLFFGALKVRRIRGGACRLSTFCQSGQSALLKRLLSCRRHHKRLPGFARFGQLSRGFGRCRCSFSMMERCVCRMTDVADRELGARNRSFQRSVHVRAHSSCIRPCPRKTHLYKNTFQVQRPSPSSGIRGYFARGVLPGHDRGTVQQHIRRHTRHHTHILPHLKKYCKPDEMPEDLLPQLYPALEKIERGHANRTCKTAKKPLADAAGM
jgi:hypothetical protein